MTRCHRPSPRASPAARGSRCWRSRLSPRRPVSGSINDRAAHIACQGTSRGWNTIRIARHTIRIAHAQPIRAHIARPPREVNVTDGFLRLPFKASLSSGRRQSNGVAETALSPRGGRTPRVSRDLDLPVGGADRYLMPRGAPAAVEVVQSDRPSGHIEQTCSRN